MQRISICEISQIGFQSSSVHYDLAQRVSRQICNGRGVAIDHVGEWKKKNLLHAITAELGEIPIETTNGL
jgi:hypothetical protein